MLSEPTAQLRVTQYATVGGCSPGTLVATRSFSGELNCIDVKCRDGRDSAASGSYCSLLLDGMTGQLCTGPAPSVEDWMYGQRAARDAREGSYARGDGTTSPWFDRSPGRPPYGRYRSVDSPYWSSDGQYRSPVVQRRSTAGQLDGPYRSADGPYAGPLDGLFAGQARSTTGPQRPDDRSPPEREGGPPVNRPGSRAADGPSQSTDGPQRSPEQTPTGPHRSPDGPLRSNDGPPPEVSYLIDLGMPDASKVNNGRVLKGRRSEFTPFKKEEEGNGQLKGLAPHKVRGSPIPADETSDEDADEPPPTGRRRSTEKQHRASKRRHHKVDGEINGVSDWFKTKMKDKRRRDDSPDSSSSSSRSSSGHR